MKAETGTTRRTLSITLSIMLSILVVTATLLGIAAPALADPSPWTQSTESHFGDGTPTGVHVESGSGDDGSVVLNTVTGNWTVDPSPDLQLSHWWDWEGDYYWYDNAPVSVNSISWQNVKSHTVPVGDGSSNNVDQLHVSLTHWSSCLGPFDDGPTAFMRVTLNGSQVYDTNDQPCEWYTTSSISQTQDCYFSVSGTGTITIGVDIRHLGDEFWCDPPYANNGDFQIERHRRYYETSQIWTYTQDLGQRVDFQSREGGDYSDDRPGGSSVVYRFQSRDEGGSWSGWTTDTGALPSGRYVQQQITLNRDSDQWYTPVVDWSRVPYQYYLAWGSLASSSHDPLSGGYTDADDWGTVAWTADTPAGTGVCLQIATNDNEYDWNYMGPGGTGATTDCYANGQAIVDTRHANDQYISYRAYLLVDENSQASTPRLRDVTITYNQEPYAPNLSAPGEGAELNGVVDLKWDTNHDPDCEGDGCSSTDPDHSDNHVYHLRVYEGEACSGALVVDENGLSDTSYLLPFAMDGDDDDSYSWRVRGADGEHGSGFVDPYSDWSGCRSFAFDTQPPTSEIDFGSVTTSDPLQYGSDANPWPADDRVSGTAQDNTGGVGVDGIEVRVRYYDGGHYLYWTGSHDPDDAWNADSKQWVAAALNTGTDPPSWYVELPEEVFQDGMVYELYSVATDSTDNPDTQGNQESILLKRHFLYDRTIGVQGRIWEDTDASGTLNGGENGIDGVTVRLTSNLDPTVFEGVTSSGGYYEFSGPANLLYAGTYTVTVVDGPGTPLEGLTLTSDPDTPYSDACAAGQKMVGLNFGYGPFALIAGYVWDDTADRDGDHDAGEPGLDQITVWLRDGGGVLQTEETGTDGLYHFKGLSAGSYQVDADEGDPEMPSPHYVATTADPLNVDGVQAGQRYEDNDVGYALPAVRHKLLYLHDGSSGYLDRNGPSGGTNVALSGTPATWTQNRAMFYDFGVDNGQDIVVHLAGSGGTADVALSTSGGTAIGGSSGLLGSDIAIEVPSSLHTIPEGDGLRLEVTGSGTLDPAGSYVDLPAVTYVKIVALGTFDAAYPGGTATANFETHDTVYVRVRASDPFGAGDITSADFDVPGESPVTISMPSLPSPSQYEAVFESVYADVDEGDYAPVVVTVHEGDEGTVLAEAQTTFYVRSADVWIAKDADPTTVQSEDTVGFTLDYGNAGALAAEDVAVVDTLPDGLTFDTMVSGPAPAVSGRQLTWNLGNLATGTGGQLAFSATVDVTGEDSDTFVNQAEISTSTGEADESDDDDDATVYLAQTASLTVDETATDLNGGDLQPGDTLRYTVVIRNHDYADATGGTVIDSIDPDVTFVDGSVTIDPPGAGTVGTPSNLVAGLTVPGRGVNPYSEVTVEFDVTVNTPLPNDTAIENTVSVRADQAASVQDSVTVYVASDHALGVSKEPADNPAFAGSPLVYTITWSVTGDEPAPDVVIKDAYPANSTYLSCSPVPCSESGGVVTWTLGDVDPDDSGEVILTVTVNSPQPDRTPLNNHVEISDDDGEFAEFDYRGFVGSGHTLSIVKTGTPDPVDAGGELTYNLAYHVSGNENAVGVLITDIVPAHTTFGSATGHYIGPDANGVITWTVGDVPVDASGSVQLVLTVDSLLPQGTCVHNTACISDANGGAPSSTSEETAVHVWHSYTIGKDDDPAEAVEAGALLTYTIDWEIDSDSTEPVSGIFVEDEIPDNTCFEMCSGGDSCGYDSGTGIVTWQLGDGQSGDGGSVALIVRVDTPLESGLVLHNAATIDDDDGDSAATSPDQATTVHSDHTLAVDKSGTPDLVEAGEVIVYVITGTVPATSNAVAPDVVITDAIPANATFEDASAGYVCPDGDGNLRWALGALDPGETRVVTFAVRVDSPLMDDTRVQNVAHISDADGESASSGPIETTVHADHELRISKVGQGNRLDGDADAITGWIDYSIDYWVPVDGNEPAPGVVVTDHVPANVTYVPGSCYPSVICSEDSGVVTWNLGDLVPGDGGTVGFRVTVPNPLPDGTVIQNVAHITDADGESSEDDVDVTVRSDHGLSIGKTDSPDPVDAGGLLTYNINYSVPGGDNEPAPHVVIEDAIPLFTTFHSASGAAAIDHPPAGGTGLVRWHLGTLMPGDEGVVQLVVRVDSPLDNGEDVFNSVTISDQDSEMASMLDIHTLVRSSHALAVEKLDTGYEPVSAGEELVYTIFYTVTGNEPSHGATLADTIPDNTTYAGCSGGVLCSQSGNQVTWILGQLNPDAGTQVVTGTAYLILQVNSPLPDETIIDNTVRFFDDTTPQVAESEDTTVRSACSYSIEKDVASEVESGDELVYTIDWTVEGNRPADGVTITDNVPPNTEFLSCSGGDNCEENGGAVTWYLGDPLYPPDAGQVSFRVGVDDLLPDGTEIGNTTTIRDAAVTVESAPVTTTVRSDHVLSLLQLDAPDPVEAGAVVEYTLDYGVSGNQYAPNVVLRDTIPGNTAFWDCTGCDGPDGNDVISWTLGTLAPPYDGSVSFRVTVSDVLPSGTSIVSFASLSDDDGKSAYAHAETAVSSHHDLTLEKRDDGCDPVQAGDLLTYTIVYGVAADGNEPAPDAVIEDSTPAHTTFYTASGGVFPPETPSRGGTGGVTWYLGQLRPGDTGMVTMVVRVSEPLDSGTILHNAAAFSDDDGGRADDAEDTTVESSHGFDVEKSGDESVDAGDSIDYLIRFTVLGNEGADGVVITDSIPANTSFVSCGGDVGCVNYGSYVRWNSGDKDPGEGGIATLRVQTAGLLPDGTTIHNVAHVSDENDGVPDDATHDTLVGSGHVLAISQTDAPDPVQAGGLINYAIDWSVGGNEMALGVVVTDRVPASTTFQSASGGVTPDADGVLTWDLGDRAPDNSGSVDFSVQVDTPLPDGVYIYNTAYVADDNGATAGDVENTRVSANHTLSVSKSDDPDPVEASGLLTYTIHYRVTGNEPAPNVVILDDVPADSIFVDAPDGTFDGGAVRWDLGNLVPGDEGDVVMVVRAEELLPDGTFIFNQATMVDDDGASATSLAQRTTLQSTHELHLEKRDTGYDPVGPGAALVYTIHYGVTGHKVAEGVTIYDDVPANTAYVSCAGGDICSRAGDRVTWFVGDVLPGEGGVVTLTLQVGGLLPDGTVITNRAAIDDDNGGAPVGTGEETTVESWHDLSIAKVDLVDPVQAGALLTYTLNLEVLGNQVAPRVVLTDRLPAEVSFVGVDASVGVWAYGRGVITWTLGDLDPGSYGPVVVTVMVDAPLSNGTVLVNTAAAFDGEGCRAGASVETAVASAPDLSSSTKMVSRDDAVPGDTLAYTITLVNSGNALAEPAYVTDVIPAHVVYVPGSVRGGATYDALNNRILWNGVVPVDAPVAIAYLAEVASPLDNDTQIANRAWVDDRVHAHFETPVAATVISSEPNLLPSTKMVDRATAEPGDTLVYTITLVNGGDMDARVSVEDGLPDHVTYIPGSASNGAVYDAFEDRVEWVGLVTTARPEVITYAVAIDSPLDGGTQIVNHAWVDDGFHSSFQTAPAITEIVAGPALSASAKLVNKTDVVPGEMLRYTIRLVNEGKMDALAVNVLDELPEDLTYLGGPVVEGSGKGFYNAGLDVVVWNGDLDAGRVVTLTYYVAVNSPLDDGTVITNTATLNYAGVVTLGPVTTTVHAAPDLTASTKTVDRGLALPGELLQYSIRLVNDGDMDAGHVRLTDTLPISTTYHGDLWQSQGVATCANGIVTWEGPVNAGDAVEITYKVRLIDTLGDGETITNVATVDDGFAVNEPFEIGPAETLIFRSLAVSIDDDRETVVPGELLTYTIAFQGEDPVSDGELGAQVPRSTRFFGATGNYDLRDSGWVDWNLDPLASNFRGSVLLVVQVNPVLPDGVAIENHVFFTGGDENARDDDTTVVASAPGLNTSTKRASVDAAYAGDALVYTITIANTGTMNAGKVVMTDTIPAYTTYVPGSISGGSYDPVAQAVTWEGKLNVGEPVTISFGVVITDSEFIPAGAFIQNVALVDDGHAGHDVLELAADTYLFSASRPDRYKVWLPLILRDHAPAVGPSKLPDLVVTEITVTPDDLVAGQAADIAVTIVNTGRQAADECFWIDLYVNPRLLPIEVNKGWFEAQSDAGLVWSVCTLKPGESVTLHYGGENYWADMSNFAGSFAEPGTYTLYAQVDSWNPETDWGAVYESDEEDNVYGPQSLVVGGSGDGEVRVSGVVVVPPPRPNAAPRRW